MKIIHMISGGDVGGAKTHVLSLLKCLNFGNEVHLVCFMEGEFAQEARAMGIPTLVLPSWNLCRTCRTLQEFVEEQNIDVVHCHGSRANLVGALLRKKIAPPVVTTVHSDPKLDYLGRPIANLIFGKCNAWALRRIRYKIGVSGPMRDMLTCRGFSPEQSFVIPNGVDFTDLSAAMTRDDFLDSVGLSRENDTVVFGIAARISPVKDMKTLVRGFAKAAQQIPSIRLVIAGDGEEREEVEALTRELGMEKKVAFAGWFQDMNSFYHAIDVNVLTSLSEGFPYVIPEAARMHCATIATNVGGIPQVIVPEKTGLLLAPGDVNALSRHMVRLTQDGGLRQRLGDALYAKCKSNYSLEATGSRQIEIYERILKLEQRRKLPRDGVLVCGAYGKGNAGDDTILQSILQQLRSRDPLLPVCVMSKRPEETALQTDAEAIYSFSLPKMMKKLKKAQLFISGGGSLIQDVTSTRSLLFYLFTIWAAHRKGCRVMMYGCGVGPVHRQGNQKLAAWVIDHCVDRITLRDPDSKKELEDWGVSRPDISVTADPALLQEVQLERAEEVLQEVGLRKEGNYCLFSLRPWKLTEGQCAAFAKAAEYVFDRYGLTPVFFQLEPRKDREISEKVAAMTKVPYILLPALKDGSSICALMKQMRLVVSMRLHALIFATGQGVPVVGIAYDPKVSSFLDYLEQGDCVKVEEISESMLCGRIDGALSGVKADRERLAHLRGLAGKNGAAAWQLLRGENGI